MMRVGSVVRVSQIGSRYQHMFGAVERVTDGSIVVRFLGQTQRAAFGRNELLVMAR